jgi:hypothetical protein
MVFLLLNIAKPPEDADFGFVFFTRKHVPSLAIGLAITRSRNAFLQKILCQKVSVFSWFGYKTIVR